MAIVLVVLFVVLATADGSRDESAAIAVDRQRGAPARRACWPTGRRFELSRRKGSWVVLNFFTHNCVPCIREHPELVDFANQQAALGVDGAELYTVVRDSDRDEVEAFFAERGGDWPIVYDPDFEFSNEFGVALVPETWIIDDNGFVRSAHHQRGDRRGSRQPDPAATGDDAMRSSTLNRTVKRWPGWVVLAFVVVALVAVGATRDGGPQTQDERITALEKRLACPVCQGESVFVSRNTGSVQIRELINQEVERGVLDDQQIIDRIVSNYNGEELLVPTAIGCRGVGVGAAGDGVRDRCRRAGDRLPAVAGQLAPARYRHRRRLRAGRGRARR